MSMSSKFKKRVAARLPELYEEAGGSFYLFDEQGIRQTLEQLKSLAEKYQIHNFKEFFAVKATPIPAVLRIISEYGCGFDCSSPLELDWAREAGAGPEDIMFTSNNTTSREFARAMEAGGCIINLDDISFLDHPFFKKNGLPKRISFRVNPGDLLQPADAQLSMSGLKAKYGIMYEQLVAAYTEAKSLGVVEFGIHAMVCSNDCNFLDMSRTVDFLFEAIEELEEETGIEITFLNMGGGIGIPYRPEQKPFDLEALFANLAWLQAKFLDKYQDLEEKEARKVSIFMESGRYVAGPHGIMVTRAINRKDIYEVFVGVEDSMVGNPRPAIYGAYHHISVVEGKTGRIKTVSKDGGEKVNIVGNICENCDQQTVGPRLLPKIRHSETNGDLVLVEDCGAHSVAMPGNYNGRTRLPAYLETCEGEFILIKRRETEDDLRKFTDGL